MDDMNIQRELIALRQHLHQHPEISGEESKTAIRIEEFLKAFSPDRIVHEIGGYGLIAEFKGKEKGPTVMFRCELDALPIEGVTRSHSESDILDILEKYGVTKGSMQLAVGSLSAVVDKQSEEKKEPWLNSLAHVLSWEVVLV